MHVKHIVSYKMMCIYMYIHKGIMFFQTLDAAVYTLELRMDERGNDEALKAEIIQVTVISVVVWIKRGNSEFLKAEILQVKIIYVVVHIGRFNNEGLNADIL